MAYDPNDYLRRREKIRAAQRAWYQQNKEKVAGWVKEYRQKNPKKSRAIQNAWRKKKRLDPEWVKRQRESRNAWAAKNRERLAEKSRIHYWENRERYVQQRKEWTKRNPERQRATLRKHEIRNREAKSNSYLTRLLRRRINLALRGRSKSANTLALIGCSVDELRMHLEKQFQPGMNWENHGEWHIDHIRPCCSFDMRNKYDQHECFHYSNLQPLWGSENCSKAGKREL